MRAIVVLVLLAAASESAQAQSSVTGSYAIDSTQSWIRILVYRSGLMSGLGHNHVVSSHDIEGTIVLRQPAADSSIELQLPVASLVVDDAEIRSSEGEDFENRVSQKDIRGTRKNMLGRKVLDAEKFPTIGIRSLQFCGSGGQLQVSAEVHIRGGRHAISFPAELSRAPDGLTISGSAGIDQRDLGLKPFSVAFGALKVAPELTIRFNLRSNATLPEDFATDC